MPDLTSRPASTIPQAAGLPILGNALTLATDVAGFLTSQYKQPGAYAPFGLGPHVCLGQGLAEMQMALTIATMFHYAQIALSPADYELDFDPVPTLSPDKKMHFEIVRWRHPLPA